MFELTWANLSIGKFDRATAAAAATAAGEDNKLGANEFNPRFRDPLVDRSLGLDEPLLMSLSPLHELKFNDKLFALLLLLLVRLLFKLVLLWLFGLIKFPFIEELEDKLLKPFIDKSVPVGDDLEFVLDKLEPVVKSVPLEPPPLRFNGIPCNCSNWCKLFATAAAAAAAVAADDKLGEGEEDEC